MNLNKNEIVKNEIIVTTITNPFSGDKVVKQVQCTNGPVFNYLPITATDEKIIVIHNGHIIPDGQLTELCPKPGDFIVIRPAISGGGGDGKNLLKVVSIIAVGIITMGVGSLIAGGAFWGAGAVAAAQWGFWSWVGAAATYYIGSYLINQAFPTPESSKSDPTYSWGGLQPMQGQGNPVQITYGSIRTAGQIISQHITTDGEKSYLNILLCGGEGEIDEISSIKINGTPISAYPGVSYDVRLGTNDQTIIPGFGDTYADLFFNAELVLGADWIIRTTEGDGGSGLEVTFDFPYGLFDIDPGDGDIEENVVQIQAQYKLHDAVDWIDWGIFEIRSAERKALRKVYRIDNLSTGRYDVRCKCIYKKWTQENEGDTTTVYWTCLSHIVYDDFCRPGRVLLGIKALATDRLSGGMPQITWVQTRRNVWVWNPITNQYEQKPADNPAWACYDLLHRCKRLKNIHTRQYEFVVKGVAASRIDYSAFLNWANYCDEIVDGASEKRCRVDIIIDVAQNLWDALTPIEAVGRGKVIIKGTQYSCICDKPSAPVQLFNVSNIGIDSFAETFMGAKDRANALEVTFTNRDKDYQRDIAFVAEDGYDDLATMQKPVQVTLNGITRYRQAYREAKYRLNLNKYLTRTVSFSADIDAIACTVGDVILVQHDVPRWGVGGRVESATSNAITLDKPVTLEPDKTYQIMIRLSSTDELVTKTVSSVSVDGKTLTVADAFTSIPQPDDLFSFGEVDKVAKPFRVMNITRDGDLRRKITALEYVEAVYAEATDIPVIDYTIGGGEFVEVTGLSAQEETFRQKDGTMVSQIRCKWYMPRKRADGFLVFYSMDNGQSWTYCTTATIAEVIIPNVRTERTYLVKVCAMRSPVVSLGVISAPVYISGKDQPPSDVPSFTLTQSGSFIKVAVEEPDDPDIDRYELRLGPTWENSVHIKNLFLPSDTIPATQEGTQTFWIKAVDRSGLKSINPTKNVIVISGLPPKNIVAERTENITTWQTTGMFFCYATNCWIIDSQAKVGDFAYFADIFASDGGAALRIDAEAILPPLDVGPSIIPEGYFYYSPYDRQIQLYTTHDGVNPATLDDYVDFWGLFAEIPVYLQPPSKFETTATVDIDWLQSSNNYISIYYRTSFDGISYNDWHYMENHQFFGRYIQVKLKPGSLDGKTNVRICGCRLAVDVPDVTEKIPITTVNATGVTRVNLINRYWAAPFVKIYSQDNYGKSCTYEIVDGTAKQNIDRSWYFEIRLWDGSTQIAGKIYGEVEGY